MRSSRAIAAAAICCVFAAVGNAQVPGDDKPEPPTPVVFLEKAYFSVLSPTGKDLLFEGQPTVHYFIYNGLADSVWQMDGGWRWAVPVSGLFLVRMSTTTSNPVLTPSYRIRPIAAQLFHLSRPSDTRFRLFNLMGAITHYSNGQRGCTFQGSARTSATGPCEVVDPDLAARRVTNTDDGDFSTTYMSAHANMRVGSLFQNTRMNQQLSAGLSYEYHKIDFKPGGSNRDQAAVFGTHQLGGTMEYERSVPTKKLAGVLRLALEGATRYGGGLAGKLNRGQVEASYVLHRAEGLGGFVRYHRGFDYYNIRFQDTAPFWTFGFIWDVGRLDRLNSELPPSK